ncbi:hypothetical protein OUZ56_002195 [Daphnia magna]|uniref:Caspase family p20 domain-containing protein n=1 Tax=Daphnia magna TaxID=35525 RepID=A0ABR0A4Y7_9CRUS|nr:hypothetical protein OUZ56_002195 [Daphnia magna]
MSSNLVKDPHASSSRTERNETPIILEDKTPLTNPQKETSSVVNAEREPFYKGSKLFRVNIGSQNAPQYLYLSHDLVKKDKSDAQENKRQIYDGFYNSDVPVAILKIEPILSGTTRKELERERRVLTELEVHENFIRYIAHEWDEDFEYIATERCLCSVADLLYQDLMKEVQMKKEILEEKRDSFEKLLTGAAASQGLEAPESRNVEKVLSTKLDVFLFCCFYHYVLISLSKKEDNKKKPRHPFGIQNLNYSVYKDKPPFNPENKDEEEVTKFIKLMLKFKEDERPTLQKVLDSSYYNPAEDYKLYEDYKSPGLCVIYNQQVFRLEKKNREGSDKDRDALSDTFKKLGFNTKVHENLESFDLKSEINALAKRNFSDFGCLVVCLLSHGIENAIQCYDGRYVNTKELKNEFSFNNCPSLYGKPKIFIVQACQGQLRQNKTDIVPHTTSLLSFFSKLSFPSRIYQYTLRSIDKQGNRS